MPLTDSTPDGSPTVPEPVRTPGRFDSEEALDEFLTRPSPALIEFVRTLRSPLLILGAGGKMGPTLAVLARRAAVAAGQALEVVAASRFSDAQAREWLAQKGVEPISVDLLDPDAMDRLPETTNIIYLVGLKF